MKNLIKVCLFYSLLFFVCPVHAAFIESYQQCKASFTLTSEGPVQISTHGGILDGVIIDSSSPGGLLTIADAWVSTKSAVSYSTIAVLTLDAGSILITEFPVYIHFGVNLSSGLTYTTQANRGGVTILWKDLRAAP